MKAVSRFLARSKGRLVRTVAGLTLIHHRVHSGSGGGHLAYESRDLLPGESADADGVQSIRKVAGADPVVLGVSRPLTMHFGSDPLLLNLDIEFRPDLSASEITAAVDGLEAGIRTERPGVKRIFIEAESLKGQALESGSTSKASLTASPGA